MQPPLRTDTASNIETLPDIISKLSEESRFRIQLLSKVHLKVTIQEYYDKKSPKQIRRSTEIANDIESFMNQIAIKLKDIEEVALRSRNKNFFGKTHIY